MLVVFCLLFSVMRCDLSIPVWSVKGTHYEVGQLVGSHFSERINQYVKQSPELNTLLLPFFATSQGKALVEQFLTINERTYPQYFRELQGLASGSGVPLTTLLLLQFADELEAGWISSVTPKPNCADIHSRGYQSTIIGHNEDAEPIIKTTAYIIDYEFTDSGEKFTAYTYPGRLPGDAWGYSKLANLTFTMNWVGPIPTTVGLARGFINRAIFGSKSLQEAIENATPQGRAFGFSLNIGDITTGKTYNFEVAPSVYSTLEVGQNFSHFNMYKELNVDMIQDESTIHRQARCDEFPIPKTVDDVRAILGDTKDSEFPIYRVATKIDPEDTVVTVIFDLVGLVAHVWDSNPKLNPPGATLALK